LKENFWKLKDNKWLRFFKGKEKACVYYCSKKDLWLCTVIIGRGALVKNSLPTLFESSLWVEEKFNIKAKLPTFFY